MEWYFKAMSAYATFKGRATRKEYWYFMLFYFLMFGLPLIIAGFIGLGEAGLTVMNGIFFVVLVIHIIPSLAVSVRRLHDINLSGWWYLIVLIPYIGGIIVSILAMLDSKEDNQYGQNPKR